MKEDIKQITNEEVWENGTGGASAQQVNTGAQAQGLYSVAEGELTTAINDPSGAIEGYREGRAAHAEGGGTLAGGNYSHAEGNGTTTNNAYEHAEGAFNKSNYVKPVYPSAGNTIHSVGIGSNLSNRKNAQEIMQNGDIYIIGVGEYNGTNPYEASTLQTIINEKETQDNKVNEISEISTNNEYPSAKAVWNLFMSEENYEEMMF